MPRGSQPSARPVLTTGQSGRQGPKGTPSRDMSARENLGKPLSKPLQEISGNSGKKPPSPITPAKLRTSRGSTSRASMVIARDSMPGGDGAGPCHTLLQHTACGSLAISRVHAACVRGRSALNYPYATGRCVCGVSSPPLPSGLSFPRRKLC